MPPDSPRKEHSEEPLLYLRHTAACSTHPFKHLPCIPFPQSRMTPKRDLWAATLELKISDSFTVPTPMHYLQDIQKFLSNKGFTSSPALFPPWGSHKVLGSKARSAVPRLSPNKQRDCFASPTEEIY